MLAFLVQFLSCFRSVVCKNENKRNFITGTSCVYKSFTLVSVSLQKDDLGGKTLANERLVFHILSFLKPSLFSYEGCKFASYFVYPIPLSSLICSIVIKSCTLHFQ